jgi:UDP-N-acetyl-D-mannosaminuronate dehydrogenase
MGEISDITPQNVKKINRDQLLKMSGWMVEHLHNRLSRAKFVVKESDPVKLQYYRVFLQAVQTHNSIIKDEDLDDIKTRLELIETALEARK